MALFPSAEWVAAAVNKLNTDQHYAQIAKNWEGDIRYVVEPGGALKEEVWIYMDLWHGKCRSGMLEPLDSEIKPAFILSAPYENMVRIVKGELDPMTALLSRKIHVHGNMAVLMRNVPTVLDFVRCCREVTDSTL
jgi:putative sterol carrier protein